MDRSSASVYLALIKPLIDKVAAVLAMLIFLPAFIAVYLILLIANKGNPIFVQSRPGKSGRVFNIYKFKTMTDARGEDGQLLPDEERLTKVGSFIRQTSLDELPQLINIIKGDLSLVGPRPLLCEYLPLYSNRQAKRHLVKPGITGWAQVNGRNNLSWPEKLELDVWYVEHVSFLLDVKILALTVMKVLKRDGILPEGQVRVERFRGEQ